MRKFNLFVLLFCLFAMSGFSQYVSRSPLTCFPAPAGTAITATFNQVPSPAAAGSIKLLYQGDIDNNTEFIEVFDENGVLIGQTTPSQLFADQCKPTLDSVSFPVTVTQLASWGADGIISFTITPQATINTTLCTPCSGGQIELTYPPVTGANDASTVSVDGPANFCSGSQSVVATVRNTGTNQITSLDINWEVNGVAQPTVSYTQLLDTLGGTGSNSAQVTLGSANFNAGNNNVRVYTANPNGVADTVNANDTVITVLRTAPIPTNIALTNVTLNSVTVAVTPFVTSADYVIVPGGAPRSSGTIVNVTTNSFTITGLAPGTAYDVYVRSNCGSGDTSLWAGPENFITSYAVPYFQDFENFPNGNFQNPWPEGWSSTTTADPNWEAQIGQTPSGGTGPTGDNTTGSGVYVYMETSGGTVGDSADFVSPPIFVDPTLSTVELSFFYFFHGANIDRMRVIVDTNGVENVVGTIIGQQQLNQSDPWIQWSTFLTGYQGKSVTIKFRGLNVTCCSGDIAVDDVAIDPVLPLNAQVSALLSPSGSLCPGNITPVVEVTNQGSTVLDSVKVLWDINGAIDSVNYIGTITPGGTAPVTLGTVAVNATTVYDVKFYTKDPNGQPDQFNADDTLAINGLRTGLSGTFTLNPGLAASATNFTDFASLETSLNSTGVCGNVVVDVAPGIYNQNLTLDNVPGLNMNNTLTIDGGDSTLVTLSGNIGANPYLVAINNSPYVTIKNMTLENTYTGTLDHYGVHLSGGTHHDSLVNLYIKMNPSNTFGAEGITASSILSNNFGEGNNANFTTVMGCNITGGDYSIHFEGGTAGSWNVGNTFINNTMSNMEQYGFYFDEQDSVTVIGNDITGMRGTFAGGVYGFDCMNMKVNENYIESPDYGIYFSDANSDKPADFNAEFINNMVSSTGDMGIYLIDAKGINFFHNSVYVEGTQPAVRFFGTLTDSIDVRNNIFASLTSEAFEITQPDTVFIKFDNNVYYTTGIDLLNIDGTAYADLASYVTAQPLYNSLSLDGDPQFASTTDLHIIGAFVNDAGDNSVGVTVDIDGETRPFAGATDVDPGADEFAPPTCAPPANAIVDQITDISAIGRWVSNTPGSVVQVQIVACGAGVGSFTNNVNSTVDSLLFTGLTPSTCYDVYLREACGRGDTSQWIGPLSFRTAIAGPRGVNCVTGSASTIFLEEFNTVGAWTGDVNTGATAADWNFGASGQTGSFNTGPSGPHSGSSYVFVETSGGNNQNAVMVSPAIDLTTTSDSAELSFWMHAFGATMGTLNVGIGTSPTGPFTNVFSWSGQLQTALADPYQQIGIRLDQYVGQVIYVEFDFLTGASFTSDIAIDLMEVIGCVACAAPDSLSATNITLTSADLDWNENGTATNWQIAWGPSGSGLAGATIVNTTTKPYSLTGLTASTAYEFYVRSACNSTDSSIWVGPFTFGTANGIPWSEDFEGFTAGNTQNPWTNDWTSNTTNIPRWESEDANNGNNENSGGTGPLWDNTFFGGPTNGMYMFTENSGATNGALADFVSPAIFVGNNPVIELEYYYFMHGATVNQMEVLVDTNGVENSVAIYTGQQQAAQTDPWLRGVHTLSGYQGKLIRIIFRHTAGSSFTSDNAIDDVSLSIPSSIDGGVSSILRPVTGCGLGAADSVEVAITNSGLQPISGFPVSYIFNGAPAVTETYTGTIAPGATANHVFSSTVNLSTVGSYTLTAFTAIATDGNINNDTTSEVIDAIPLVGSLPYTESFETGAGGWVTSGANSSWAVGTPAATYINTAGHGTQAWVTNLTGTHNNSELSYIESPCFDMSTLVSDPIVSFLHIYNTESCCDEGWMELSTDGGQNWNKVLDLGSAVNWYNDNFNQWWDGDNVGGSGVWDTTSNVLNGAAGSSDVKVRFVFSSDGSVINEGFGVDSIFMDGVVGIEEVMANESSFTVYPNPSNGQFRLVMNSEQDQDYTLIMRDAQGKLIMDEQLNVNGFFMKDYDFESLAKGVYFLNLQSDEESVVKKLIIQ